MPIPCSQKDRELQSFVENCNGDVARRVDDPCSRAVLNQILVALGGNAGVPFHENGTGDTLAIGTPLNVLSSTVPGAITRNITKVVLSTRAAGEFEIKINGTKVGGGRTNASDLNVNFDFSPAISSNSGDVIDIEFTMLRGPVDQCVDVYLMATDIT